MNMSQLSVAIAGAGMGGLALATKLARAGARVVIYDQMQAPQPVGSGFVLQPTGAAVLSEMGLLERIEARGARIERMLGRLAGDGKTVLHVAYRNGQHGLAVQRVALFELLLEAAIGSGVVFETGARVEDHVPGSEPAFLFQSGRRSPRFDLLVDATGAGSPLGQEEAPELVYGALWATVPWPEDGRFDVRLLEQRYDRASRMAGVLPVGSAKPGAPDMATFFWSLRNRDHQAWQADGRDAWVEEVSRLWPEAAPFAEIAEPVHARYRHYTRRPVVAARLLRIGDAWHATSPQLGQGANMALLDAASLADALIRGRSVDDAIAMHLKQRAIHIRLYQLLSRVLTPFYQSDSRLLPLLRDALIGPVTTLPMVRAMITTIVTGDLLDPVGRIGRG